MKPYRKKIDGEKTATVVPDNLTPNRKWFANLFAIAITWVVVKLGLDDATAASIAAPVAGLAANYAWSEWKTLPDYVREFVRKLSRQDGEASSPVLLIVIGIVVAVLVHWSLGVALILIGLALLLAPHFQRPGRG